MSISTGFPSAGLESYLAGSVNPINLEYSKSIAIGFVWNDSEQAITIDLSNILRQKFTIFNTTDYAVLYLRN